MATEVPIDSGGLESSLVVEMVNDSTLTAYTSAPEYSTVLHVGKIGIFSFFVNAVPETGQEIHLQVQSCPHNDESIWYAQGDGDNTDLDDKVWVIKQTTNPGPVEIGPFYGATRYVRVKYGYSGGTGLGASLKVYFMGRAQ